MQPLLPPDSHCLLAALGWLELGLRADARAELATISAENQRHPDVLEVRWMICAEEKSWSEALGVARRLVELAPARSSGWLHQAYALRRVPEGGLEQAWTALAPAAEKFPKEPIIAYNLACYACQLKRYEEARRWFKRALKVGDPKQIRRMALADEDLQPLWDEIPAM